MPVLSLQKLLALCPSAQIVSASNSSTSNTVVLDHITLDSRKATDTSIFVALKGAHIDGREFIPSTASPIILVDCWSEDWTIRANGWNCTILLVSNARSTMAKLASILEGEPSKRLKMIGITGTNGKTTTTWMLSHILENSIASIGLTPMIGTIGTIGHRINGQPLAIEDGFTTPESPGLQRSLRQFVEADCSVCIMEVSSIGLMMERVGSIAFDIAAFTNFTQDHLDIHSSMDAYLNEKRKLFANHLHEESLSILVVDQPEIANTPISKGRTERIGIENTKNCDWWIEQVHYTLGGSHFHCHSPHGHMDVFIPLIGEHNIQNALVALAASTGLGISLRDAIQALSSLPQAPGRLERVQGTKAWHAFVDYAHTPDALEKSLESLRVLCQGKLWVVFGCGGDRDAGKRPQMGRIAADLADGIVITSDNPRSENPLHIIQDIEKGIPVNCQKPTRSIVLRGEAIQWVITQLQPTDVLLVAGKGHENYQIIQGVKYHFDDCEEISKHI